MLHGLSKIPDLCQNNWLLNFAAFSLLHLFRLVKRICGFFLLLLLLDFCRLISALRSQWCDDHRMYHRIFVARSFLFYLFRYKMDIWCVIVIAIVKKFIMAIFRLLLLHYLSCILLFLRNCQLSRMEKKRNTTERNLLFSTFYAIPVHCFVLNEFCCFPFYKAFDVLVYCRFYRTSGHFPTLCISLALLSKTLCLCQYLFMIFDLFIDQIFDFDTNRLMSHSWMWEKYHWINFLP